MTEQQFSQLDTLLLQGISLLEALSTIYDKELEALSSKDLDLLSDITQEKTGLLNRFHNFTLERVELLKSFSIETSKEDYSSAGLSEPFASKIDERNLTIKSHLKELQQKNNRNEQTIYRNQQNINQLLSIVRGHDKKDQLYNKAGGSGLYKAQSRIGKA